MPDNPVTAAPAVSPPDTAHCTVRLAEAFPSNAPDGSSSSFYRGDDDTGARYRHYLASKRGRLTKDHVRPSG